MRALAFGIALALQALGLQVSAAETDTQSSLNFACRGSVCITVGDLARRFDGFPEAVRRALLDSPDQMEQLVDDMLLRRQLVERAAAMELESDPDVAVRVRAARERVLADETLQRLIDVARPNFETLARERYITNPKEWQVGAHRRVQHLLVALEGRSEAEALRLAEELRAKAIAGADFAGLLQQYSDDPSKVENQGIFEVSSGASLVEEFKSASMQLAKTGDLSEPVRTQFGFHLIKFISDEAGRQLSIEEAVPRIAAQLETDWLSARREATLQELRRVGTEYDREGFEALRGRY